MNGPVLPVDFYERDPETVAKELLGKILIRKLSDHEVKGLIVETEAYSGMNDPASRAYNGKMTYNQLMWGRPGRAFIYNVHRYWMLNIVAHKPCEVGAVLLRAVEPIGGIEHMKRYRPVNELVELTNGPGKLTLAMQIDKNVNGASVASQGSEIQVLDHASPVAINRSHRIGVRRDVERPLRFFIAGNGFVSK
jgi:DNA-3-methyladenine glycosylase